MANYCMPGVMYNLVGYLGQKLPITEGVDFRASFEKALRQVPHAEQQSFGDDSEPSEYVPASDGDGHLDAIWHWYMLGLLVDPEWGVAVQARSAEDRTGIARAADLYRRWLEEDPPSQEEWDAAAMGDPSRPEQDLSLAETAAWMTAMIHTGTLLLVDNLIVTAALCFTGQKVPGWADRALGDSGPPRLLHRTVNWIGSMVRRSPGGNPRHYRAQAHWFLQLMKLRWLPDDAEEEAAFRALAGGDLAGLPGYRVLLRKKNVAEKVIDRQAATLERMAKLRRLARYQHQPE